MINLFGDEGKTRNTFHNVKSKLMMSTINISYNKPNRERL